MNQWVWLESCSRRLMELDDGIDETRSNHIAVRMWNGASEGRTCREMHPVAAAELWIKKQGLAARNAGRVRAGFTTPVAQPPLAHKLRRL